MPTEAPAHPPPPFTQTTPTACAAARPSTLTQRRLHIRSRSLAADDATENAPLFEASTALDINDFKTWIPTTPTVSLSPQPLPSEHRALILAASSRFVSSADFSAQPVAAAMRDAAATGAGAAGQHKSMQMTHIFFSAGSPRGLGTLKTFF